MPFSATIPQEWLIPLIIVIFPIFFTGLWCFVCLLLSTFGGWSRLAKKYPGTLMPTGTCFSGQTGRVGGTNYKSILTIHASAEGLHISVMKFFRIGHPPLFIPWTEIHHPALRRFFWFESVVFEVGLPSVAKVGLPRKVFAGQPIRIEGCTD